MLRITQKAEADPVSLQEAKQFLRIDFADDDALITALISAATISAQNNCQRLFMAAQAEYVMPCWRHIIEIPIAPVTKDAINSIKYVDWVTQQQQTLDPSLYVVQTWGPSVRIVPAFGAIWPLLFTRSPEPVVINFNVGAADAADVPENVKVAIKLILGHMYENRQDVIVDASRGVAIQLPQGAEALLLSEQWGDR